MIHSLTRFSGEGERISAFPGGQLKGQCAETKRSHHGDMG
ncbi:Hypothetical protein ABZS17G119_03231 [Kosakonia cowanii]